MDALNGVPATGIAPVIGEERFPKRCRWGKNPTGLPPDNEKSHRLMKNPNEIPPFCFPLPATLTRHHY